MTGIPRPHLLACFLGAALLGSGARISLAQNPPPDQPAVTVKGQTYTPRSILARNMGTPEDQTTQFPPHKIIGNIYYVGTRTLSSFLIVTPQGNILIDSTYERNVKTIEKSVTDLGFKFADVKILLGNHAHGDHQEGDALVKQMTGARVMAMAEDVPALQAMKPGGKEHPIDSILHDGDAVMLGGVTLDRPSDARPHARLHDLDDERAGGWKDLQRGLQLQSAGPRDADAGGGRRDDPLVQAGADAAV